MDITRPVNYDIAFVQSIWREKNRKKVNDSSQQRSSVLQPNFIKAVEQNVGELIYLNAWEWENAFSSRI